MRILFVVPYPNGAAPSQRFRFEQYFNFLKEKGHMYHIAPFWSARAWNVLYSKGNIFKKAIYFVFSLLKRCLLPFKSMPYHYIFIHREAAPLGPPVLEWILAKILRKKIIYDFDDAIWLPNTSKENSIIGFLKFHNKTASICKWSYKVSVGNSYLADYASQYINKKSIVINPTTLDLKHHHNRIKNHTAKNTITIGWTGTHSTNKYLELLVPSLQKLEHQFDIRILVISNQNPHLLLKCFDFIKWNKQTEIDQLLQFDIGIMPLKNSPWELGKCGFKALQYMALGIPAVASAVGVNNQIIEDGKTGFLCTSTDEWEASLSALIKSEELRANIGNAAHKSVNSHYSVSSNRDNFLSLFTK